MLVGLFQYVLVGINEDECNVSCRSFGYYILGVLNVAWCIGDDEFVFGC